MKGFDVMWTAAITATGIRRSWLSLEGMARFLLACDCRIHYGVWPTVVNITTTRTAFHLTDPERQQVSIAMAECMGQTIASLRDRAVIQWQVEVPTTEQ